MSVFDSVDTADLLNRYNSLIEKYVKIAKEIAPQLEKFGKYRQELQEITVEFINRGVTPQDPDSLIKVMQEELEKRDIKEDAALTDQNK
jgi:hypothetical protein